MHRRELLTATLGALGALALPARAAPPRRALLRLAGPAASVSLPLQWIAAHGGLAALADKVEFVPWRDPDELRLIAIEGRADVIGLPVNVAANLYNRGVPLRLLNVAAWGMLWLVSQRSGTATLADFRGEEIAMPFRGDMPDIVFGLVARAQGLDPKRDFKLRYVGTPMDALQLLIARRVDHALLAEPAVSMALRKTRTLPLSVVAPALHRSVDLQQEWARVLHRTPRIAQAGIAVLGTLRDDAPSCAAIARAYAAAASQCRAEPGACGALAVRHDPRLDADAVADALGASPLDPVATRAARPDIERLLGDLHAANPALVGGRLPDDGFYGGAA